MRREDLAAVGAVGASLLIASCCLAPTVFLVLGASIGALGLLTGLEPYRPLFVVLGAVALAYAAWRAWRPEPAGSAAACGEASCAPESPQRRRTRRLVAAAILLYGFAIAYPYALAALL